jgi:hypothetical protein
VRCACTLRFDDDGLRDPRADARFTKSPAVHVVDKSKKPRNGSSRSFARDPIKAGQLPKADLPDSMFGVGATDTAPDASGPSPAIRKLAQRMPASRHAPLRAVGVAAVGASMVYAVLWSLGALFSTVGERELQQFNAGRPVMLCTAGGYRAVDNSLIGRVFGERHFTCRDWKMGI